MSRRTSAEDPPHLSPDHHRHQHIKTEHIGRSYPSLMNSDPLAVHYTYSGADCHHWHRISSPTKHQPLSLPPSLESLSTGAHLASQQTAILPLSSPLSQHRHNTTESHHYQQQMQQLTHFHHLQHGPRISHGHRSPIAEFQRDHHQQQKHTPQHLHTPLSHHPNPTLLAENGPDTYAQHLRLVKPKAYSVASGDPRSAATSGINSTGMDQIHTLVDYTQHPASGFDGVFPLSMVSVVHDSPSTSAKIERMTVVGVKDSPIVAQCEIDSLPKHIQDYMAHLNNKIVRLRVQIAKYNQHIKKLRLKNCSKDKEIDQIKDLNMKLQLKLEKYHTSNACHSLLENSEREKIVSFPHGIKLTAYNLKDMECCEQGEKGDSAFILKLLVALYTREELRVMSITGKPSRNKKYVQDTTKKFCPAKLQFIKDKFCERVIRENPLPNEREKRCRPERIHKIINTKIQNLKRKKADMNIGHETPNIQIKISRDITNTYTSYF